MSKSNTAYGSALQLAQMAALNREGLSWREWYAAATLGQPCCTPTAWCACSSSCPRIHPRHAPAAMLMAWNHGVAPTDWKGNQP